MVGLVSDQEKTVTGESNMVFHIISLLHLVRRASLLRLYVASDSEDALQDAGDLWPLDVY